MLQVASTRFGRALAYLPRGRTGGHEILIIRDPRSTWKQNRTATVISYMYFIRLTLKSSVSGLCCPVQFASGPSQREVPASDGC